MRHNWASKVMPTSNQKLQEQIAELEKTRLAIKKKITSLKKQSMDRETELIETTLRQERLVEELRVYQKTTVTVELNERDQEIEGFRSRYPELCQKEEIDGDD